MLGNRLENDRKSTGNLSKSTRNQQEIYRKSIGNRPEMVGKSTGSRPEIDQKSIGNRPEIARKSIGNRLEISRKGGGPFFRRLQEDSLEKPPGEGNSQNRQILSKIEPERAPEMMPKHRKSLPNGRQQGGAFGAAPKGAALRAAPFGVLVVFHLVRISYVLASFPEPVLARF